MAIRVIGAADSATGTAALTPPSPVTPYFLKFQSFNSDKYIEYTFYLDEINSCHLTNLAMHENQHLLFQHEDLVPFLAHCDPF